MDTDVLTVLPHVAKKTRVMVASPSQEEKNLRAAGTSAGAIFFSVGAKAFNAPLITKLAMEKKEERRRLKRRRKPEGPRAILRASGPR